MGRILIVDDVDVNIMMLSMMLEDEYEIVQASGGKEAIARMEEYACDFAAVLLDIVMPDMNGIEVLEVMNRRGWIDKLPILVTTGDRDDETDRKCLELGAAGFICKPFAIRAVKESVHDAIDSFDGEK